MARTCVRCVFQISPGADLGWVKIGQGGPFQKTSSDSKATATNGMYINDLEACGKKCYYFGSIPKCSY